jgi:hypothetical protein
MQHWRARGALEGDWTANPNCSVTLSPTAINIFIQQEQNKTHLRRLKNATFLVLQEWKEDDAAT